MRKQKAIQQVFAPLNASIELIIESGALHQIFRPDTDEFAPDRGIVPLVLYPLIRVTDTDGVFGDGIANARLADIKWLANKVSVSGNSKYAIDTSGTDKRGTLRVYQNVKAGETLSLYFEGTVNDTRNGTALRVNACALLNTNAVSKEKVTVEIDKPVTIIYDPLVSPAELTIKAAVFLADNILLADNARLWWYKRLDDDTLSLVDPEDDLEYVSGINTSALMLDQRYINEKKDYRVVADFVKSGTSAPSAPTNRSAFRDFTVRRLYPQWDFEVADYGNLTADQKTIPAEMVITAGRRLVESPDRYFCTRWHSVDRTGIERMYGFGEKYEIPATIPGLSTGEARIGADVNEKESLKALAVNGKILTIGGKIIVV